MSDAALRPIKQIVEASLLVSPEPLTVERLQALFGDTPPSRDELRAALVELETDCAERGYELVRVASGWRFQVKQSLAPWIARLYTERPVRYTRALLETLALVAYRQPVTRGDIEEVRGVAVSTGIMRTLLERNWIRVVAYREVPGRPALYGTTKEFLDYFSLSNLEELPPLSEVRDLDDAGRELELSLGLDPSAEYGHASVALVAGLSGPSDGDLDNASTDERASDPQGDQGV